jgi:hypothetical protein
MMKSSTAIMVAATVAAAVTILSAPSGILSAGARPDAESAQMRDCAARPWPYLLCVGTRYGNPRVRLVTTNNLSK